VSGCEGHKMAPKEDTTSPAKDVVYCLGVIVGPSHPDTARAGGGGSAKKDDTFPKSTLSKLTAQEHANGGSGRRSTLGRTLYSKGSKYSSLRLQVPLP
jgi:hypothetical protein